MDDDDDVLICAAVLFLTAAAVYCNSLEKPKRGKIYGVRQIYRERKLNGDYYTLIPKLRREDWPMHFVYFRMTPDRFDVLLSKIAPRIRKYGTNEPLEPGHKLAITLRYLATGLSMTGLTFEFLVSKTTVSRTVREVCNAIWDSLRSQYLPVPQKDRWKQIADSFYTFWDAPNCIGAIDGKHVNIVCPAHSGSHFYNYKQTYSMVLLAACDAKRAFTIIEVGCNGRVSDGDVLRNSEFGQRLENKRLEIPGRDLIPGTNIPASFYFVADEAFPLRQNIQRPFPGRGLSLEKRVFNYRISRARILFENAFGILAARWRILHTSIYALPDTAEAIIKCICALHNFILYEDEALPPIARQYCPPSLVDTQRADGTTPGEWRQSGDIFQILGRVANNNATGKAEQQRMCLMDYFMSENGALPWQENYVTRGEK